MVISTTLRKRILCELVSFDIYYIFCITDRIRHSEATQKPYVIIIWFAECRPMISNPARPLTTEFTFINLPLRWGLHTVVFSPII
jgi:hypothetical protein